MAIKLKIQEHTKQGVTNKQLTEQEIIDLAATGNYAARKEIAKNEVLNASSIQEELDAIKKLLGI